MCLPRPRRHRYSSTASPISNVAYRRLSSPPPTPRMMTPKPTASAPMPTIIIGSSSSGAAPVRVSSQHERLLVELLPFKDVVQFREWIGSAYVRGPWNEFYNDYLLRAGEAGGGAGPAGIPEPDKARTAQTAREALNSRKPKYLVYHPDKTGWTPEDHHVRFIVTLVADNMLQGLWYESEWKKRGFDIAKAAYEVLIFLKATVYIDPNPPSYSA
ncbi:hypothetical protein CMUS01_03545 [Colletotrichum musicola]|uniref:Uncharacterized protein n=1 Tax=Colletotrichum musicola TaxID=2175873 RepID=A0A8H6NS12_9PEZI|nr:hypothetical protein CMUS01_03545 [Colletotrichum musicola]